MLALSPVQFFGGMRWSGTLSRCGSVLIFVSCLCLRLEGLCSSPTYGRSRDPSVIRRLKREAQTSSTPLSQRWYKSRQQHVSKAQKTAIREHWPVLGIDLKYGMKVNPLDLWSPKQEYSSGKRASNSSGVGQDEPNGHKKNIFCTLDIGFGTGDSIVQMAANNPECFFIGCEIHKSGIGATIQKILGHPSLGMSANIKLIRADIQLLLGSHLEENSIDEVCIYFPDPWPNNERDANRRIVRDEILYMLANVMKKDGMLKIVTDVEDYAAHVRSTMRKHKKVWQPVIDGDLITKNSAQIYPIHIVH